MPYYKKKLVLNRIKAASAIRFIRQIKQSIKTYNIIRMMYAV